MSSPASDPLPDGSTDPTTPKPYLDGHKRAAALQKKGLFDFLGKDALDCAKSLMSALTRPGTDSLVYEHTWTALSSIVELSPHLFFRHLPDSDDPYEHDTIKVMLGQLEKPMESMAADAKAWVDELYYSVGEARRIVAEHARGQAPSLKAWKIICCQVDMSDRLHTEVTKLLAELFDLAILHPFRDVHQGQQAHPLYIHEDKMASLSLALNELYCLNRTAAAKAHTILRSLEECTTIRQRNCVLESGVKLRSKNRAVIQRVVTSASMYKEDGGQSTVAYHRDSVQDAEAIYDDDKEDKDHNKTPVAILSPRLRTASLTRKVDVPESIAELRCRQHNSHDYDCEKQCCPLTAGEPRVPSASVLADMPTELIHIQPTHVAEVSGDLGLSTPNPQTAPPLHVDTACPQDDEQLGTPAASVPWTAPLAHIAPWITSPNDRLTKSHEKPTARAIFGSTTRGQRIISGGLQPLALTTTLQDELEKRAESDLRSPSEIRARARETFRPSAGSVSRLPIWTGRNIEPMMPRDEQRSEEFTARRHGNRWIRGGAELQMAKSLSNPEISLLQALEMRPRTDTI